MFKALSYALTDLGIQRQNNEDYYYSNAIARASKTMSECKSDADPSNFTIYDVS